MKSTVTNKYTSTEVDNLAIKRRALLYLGNPNDELVSPFSRWREPRWTFEDGQVFSLNWELVFDNGTCLTDTEHQVLLDSARRFMWSLFYEPLERDAPPLRSGPSLLSNMRPVLSWMVKTHRADFSELGARALEEFLEDWVATAEDALNRDSASDLSESELADSSGVTTEEDDDEDDEDQIGFNSLYNAVTVWMLIWVQTPALSRAGIPTMSSDPLRGRSALAVTKDVVDFIVRITPPLPDEVALPIMNEASRWLGIRANDIVRLHNACMKVFPLVKDRNGGHGLMKSQVTLFPTFEFSTEPGSNAPWHEPLGLTAITKTKAYDGSSRTRYALPIRETRILVDALYGACIITLESESAVRPGEAIRLKSGKQVKSGEPFCVSKKLSPSGLNELFFLIAPRKKGLKSAEYDEWLAGSRPVGSEFIPGPIRAVEILESLLAPWRIISPDNEVKERLFIAKRANDTLPKFGASVIKAKRSKLLTTQRDFIERYVDLKNLPDRSSLNENLVPYRESKGRCITTTQWRKTYAMYAIRTDRRMLPEIATQFKHMNVAMTESSYIGNNPQLMREANSQQHRAAAAFMYRTVTGKEPVAGRIAKLINEYRDSISRIIGGEENTIGLSNLQAWCEERGIRAYSSPHGKCFIGISPLDAACHQVSGTASWRVTRPNLETREPSLCAGCRVFGVDLDHADFWVQRYVESQTAWLNAKKRGLTQGFRVIQERAAVSANMLRVLRIPLPNVGE